MSSLSVALPAYDEEPNIGPMIEDVIRVVAPLTDGDFEVIVVDDGSHDATTGRVREMAVRHPQVRLIEHKVNQGYGAAVYDGIINATREWVFFTDADRQFVLEDLPSFWEQRETADLVIGYRSPRRDSFIRRLNGFGWTWLTNLLFGYLSQDVDCAFKLFRREVVQTVGPRIESFGATFSAEFLVRAKRAGFTSRELPVRHLPRQVGSQTGARLYVIVRAFRELFRLRLKLWRKLRERAT